MSSTGDKCQSKTAQSRVKIPQKWASSDDPGQRYVERTGDDEAKRNGKNLVQPPLYICTLQLKNNHSDECFFLYWLLLFSLIHRNRCFSTCKCKWGFLWVTVYRAGFQPDSTLTSLRPKTLAGAGWITKRGTEAQSRQHAQDHPREILNCSLGLCQKR